MKMAIIPEGFAHGFQSLEDNSEVIYLTTQYFSTDFERALNIRDPRLNIKLPVNITDLSERDKNHAFISETTFESVIL